MKPGVHLFQGISIGSGLYRVYKGYKRTHTKLQCNDPKNLGLRVRRLGSKHIGGYRLCGVKGLVVGLFAGFSGAWPAVGGLGCGGCSVQGSGA